MIADDPHHPIDRAPTGTPLPAGDAYELVRAEIRTVLAGAPQHLATAVPACPEWNVRQLVAHLTGNCLTARAAFGSGGGRADAGVMPPPRGAPDPEWTRQQVDGLAGLGLAELLATWGEAAAEVVPRIRSGELTAHLLVMDAIMHRFDLGIAVGEEPPREHRLLANALEFLAGGFLTSAAGRGCPPLRIHATDLDAVWISHDQADTGGVATLAADRYDLARSLGGRRTLQQVAALTWDADPQPWLMAFQWGPFKPPSEAVE